MNAAISLRSSPFPSSRRAKEGGFTLIELMLVVVLAGIMLGIGIPSFRDFIASQRVKTAAGEYASALVEARSEAIKRNANVTVTAVGAGASGWQSGWTVAVAGTTLSTHAAYPSALTFDGPTAAVTYLGSGRLSGTTTPPPMCVCGQDGSKRCVAIDLSGMPKSTITSGTCP